MRPPAVNFKECMSLIGQIVKLMQDESSVTIKVSKQKDAASYHLETIHCSSEAKENQLGPVRDSPEGVKEHVDNRRESQISQTTTSACVSPPVSRAQSPHQSENLADETADDDESIVIDRSASKGAQMSNRRASSRIKLKTEELSEHRQELQEKLRKTPRVKRNPIVENDSSDEQSDRGSNGNGSSGEEEIVISRSACKRTPSSRITKLESRKIKQQEKVLGTLGKISVEKRPKNRILSEDEESDGDQKSEEKSSSAKKRKRPVIDDLSQDPSSIASNGVNSKSQDKEDESESDFQMLEDSDVDGIESDRIEGQASDEEMVADDPNWRKALHEVIDSNMQMSRTTESECSAFLKVIYMYLNAASFPGKGYPLHVNDPFRLYPQEKAPNFRKCLQVVTDKVSAMLGKFSRATSWKSDFQFLVDRIPEITLGYTSQRTVCEACGRKNTVTTESIDFHGDSYNPKTYELIKSRDLDYTGPMRFLIGSHCSNRIEMYHLLRHYLFNLFMLCKKYVQANILLDSRRIRRKSTDIEKDLKRIASEDNEWAMDLYYCYKRDMERANTQRAGLDWSFER